MSQIIDPNNLRDITKDIITHPADDLEYLEELFDQFDFKESDMRQLSNAFNILKNDPNLSEDKKREYAFSSWKLIYRTKPPTIKEFLTEEYIGEVANSTYSHVKDWVTEFMDFSKPWRNLVLTPAIGAGKSYATSLITLYYSYVLYHCRDPKKLLGLSKATSLSILFVSFTVDKVKELLGEIYINMMNASPKFQRCQTLDQMNRRRKADPSMVYWSTAGATNYLDVGDINIKVTSNLQRLLGLSIILCNVSELSFFGTAGKSPEDALKLYEKAIDRIFSRLHGNVWGRSILDSSPYDRTLPLENYIWNEVMKHPEKYPDYYIVKGSQWSFPKFHDDYPLFYKENKSFPIFIGSGSQDPKMISESERPNYPEDLVIDMPEDLRQQAENRLIETVRDFAGIPMGGDDVLIRNKAVLESLFTPSLRNLYDYIQAPSDLNPEGLIFDQIKHKFFVSIGNNKWEFYRNPRAERFLSVDQSISGDLTGIGMSHVEVNDDGELVFIVDFSIVISPGKGRINLDAIKLFIHELRKYGGLNIARISFDQFQSESTMQYLKRHDFEVERLSVDIHMSPYLNFVSYMEQNRVKMGRNIIMKNNLKSLRVVETPKSKKKKIDHLPGKVSIDKSDSNWDISRMGYYGKDISDAVVASVELTSKYGTKNPRYLYDESQEEEAVVNKKKMKSKILDMYGLS